MTEGAATAQHSRRRHLQGLGRFDWPFGPFAEGRRLANDHPRIRPRTARPVGLRSPESKCWRGSESQAFATKPTTTVRRRRRRRHTTRDLKREPSTSSSNSYTRRSSSNARCSVNSRVLNPSVNQPREPEREARGVIPFALIAAACTKLMILKSPQYRM